MTTLTDRDDAEHLAADLATVRRAAAATDPRGDPTDEYNHALLDGRPVPAEVRLAYLAGELEGALRELAAWQQAYAIFTTGLSVRVRRYMDKTRGEHFRARVRRAANALDAALARLEEGAGNARP